ncbi:uncharacterized protein AC631_02695 [Debaryomyces fabryi]|uniref:Structural maintenance of chromosomes protein 5 n=1 Tax=Debaryomyces fabryi TaxID=58627 RepID=A0A0V1PZ56_9ASCO|nr:uncharacterized protein AC631_02695 [Debaryomyces fabryi]KSA01550.1 hypothetical protein AC631_02695 [Debaryomyces fabryi]CUM51634.1 unnamed protein product [Debaryomyces fabryi]
MSELGVVGNFSDYINDTDNHIPKKRRLNWDDEKFKPGFILRVKVKNFTTYSYAEFNLSPTLNMIIGPNGTGKSTLVAAICLGLGGKIDLIKRKTMKSMIKTGQQESIIEITLKDSEPDLYLVIQRKFTEKESSWELNGVVSDEKLIRKICKKFNIQLDNLCHFLPQERVAEFAGLSPELLLLETQRTVGSGHLLAMHEDLIAKDNMRESLKTDIASIEERLIKLTEEKDRLQEEARRFEEYQEKTQDLINHKMLIPYAQLQDLKERQKHIKKERDLAKKKLENFKSNTRPIEIQLQQAQQEYEVQDAKFQESKSAYQELIASYDNRKEEISKNLDTIAGLKMTKTTLSNKNEMKRVELDKLRQEKEELLLKLNNMPQVDENELLRNKNLRDEKHEEINDLKSDVDNAQDKADSLISQLNKLKKNIQEEQKRSSSNDKIVVLESNGRYRSDLLDNAYGAHMYLREQAEIKDLYFEAPVVSCEIVNKKYAKFAEKVIDNNTLLALTIPTQEVYDKVSQVLFSKYNAPLRITQEVASTNHMSKDELNSYGFEGFLSDYISGPKAVLNMLNVISKVHLIPVSSKPLSDQQFEKLLQPDGRGRIPFMRFVAGDSLFTVSRSRYGSKQYLYTTEQVQEARLFGSTGLTQEVKKQLQDNIERMIKEHKTLRAELDRLQNNSEPIKLKHLSVIKEFNVIKAEVDRLQNLKKGKAKLETYILQKDERIKKMERDAQKDYTEKIKVIEKKVKEKYDNYATATSELSNMIKKITFSSIKLDQDEFLLLQTQNRIVTAEQLKSKLMQYKESLEKSYEEAKQKYNEIKKSDAAQKIREQNASYTDEQREVLSHLAGMYMDNNTLTEKNIREKIQLLEDERALMSTADQSSIETLKSKLHEIEVSERELPNLRNKKEQLDERIDKIYEQWEPELSDLVLKISKAFQKKFTTVASDGQVELAKEKRFKDWKLQILVKFRENSDLKVLDHQSQSGGERAVSTIFFIMSLQGLTDAPFRIVDEINQGMDPRNEKMAHKYLVHTACQNNKSQYFLVTPKLLTGLYYHPDMVVHCIYTGPLIDAVEKDSDKPDFMDLTRSALVTVT